jgi:flagellar secretion chaperone FliS
MMFRAKARNAYQQTATQTEIHPVKLIHMIYERVLSHLSLVRKGIENNDPKTRGENLGKVIALITELNVSIKSDDKTDAASFLRGLYGSILVELPRVALTNNIEVVIKVETYIKKLMKIWEQTAMMEAGFVDGTPAQSDIHKEEPPQAPGYNPLPAAGRNDNQETRSVSFSI